MTTPAYIISDDHAKWLMDNLKSLDRDARALLKIWCFHNQPPQKLLITVNWPLADHGFTEYGDRLGTISLSNGKKDHLYLFADNGLTYYGKLVDKEKRVYRVIANLGDWKRKLEKVA